VKPAPVDLVVRLVDEVMNGNQLDALDQLCSPQLARRLRTAFRDFRAAFSDWHEHVLEMVTDGRTVVARMRCTGTHRGRWQGLAATGRTVRVDEVYFFRTADDRITGLWGLEDNWTRRRQLAGDDVALGELGSLSNERTPPMRYDDATKLRDGQAAIDALYRFAAGQDLKDAQLFRSAFAPHATLDFTEPAGRFGANIPVMHGRAKIEQILTTLEPLVTSHTVTNPRVETGEDRATLSALVEAQHVTAADPSRRLLLKNTYDVSLVRDGDRFVIEAMTIRNLWFDGEPAVLFGAPTHGHAGNGQRVPDPAA
jgi:predicted ester cyclase